MFLALSAERCSTEVQVMKMLLTVLSPAAGHVHYKLLPGAVMKAGDLIARLDLDDPASITQAQPFKEGFPEMGPPLVFSSTVNDRFKQALNAAQMIIQGKLYICHSRQFMTSRNLPQNF